MNNIIDVEEFARSNKPIPKGKKYLIKVDREKYRTDQECLTGREILLLAGKTPFTKFQLNQKLRKGVVKKVSYDEKVDLTTCGVERFMTLPLDQTEG